MVAYSVPAASPWVGLIMFGEIEDRTRLDDWDIYSHLKAPGDPTILIEMTLTNGRLVISDPVSRRLEINVGWEDIAPLATTLPATFEFDFVFINRATGIHERNPDIHTLTVTRGVTFPEI